ncbi:MAG: glycogen debranching enzyme, partial [Deltaproteobacteria bacterium]|nr:glycogen debranching enzyme [Deltaproteobacteria bacterium]
MKQACSKLTIRRGRPLPFGATPLADGVNFAVFSRHATAVSLVLFHPLEKRPCAEFALDSDRHRTGDVWHIFVEGLLPGFAYGYKVEGLGRSTDPRHR